MISDRNFDRLLERLEKTRAGLLCSLRGNTITQEQYIELVEEVHILMHELNLHAHMNQIPIELPEGFVFAEPQEKQK